MAVLYRASYLSRSIEQAFIREKIPYVIWGGVRFFERKEIKDALGYLRLVALDDDMAFKRIANVPSRKIGKKTMALLQTHAASQGCTLFTALVELLPRLRNTKAEAFAGLILEARRVQDSMTISTLLEKLLEGSGLLEEYRTDTEEERLENLQELVKSIRLYEEENREEDSTLDTYLQDIALYTNADYRKDDDKVKLMTVHQAKGLEFPLVWIYGLSEGIMPSHRTVRERGEAGLEEERRLMYVACTRAKDRLYFSDSEGFNVQNSQSKYGAVRPGPVDGHGPADPCIGRDAGGPPVTLHRRQPRPSSGLRGRHRHGLRLLRRDCHRPFRGIRRETARSRPTVAIRGNDAYGFCKGRSKRSPSLRRTVSGKMARASASRGLRSLMREEKWPSSRRPAPAARAQRAAWAAVEWWR